MNRIVLIPHLLPPHRQVVQPKSQGFLPPESRDPLHSLPSPVRGSRSHGWIVTLPGPLKQQGGFRPQGKQRWTAPSSCLLYNLRLPVQRQFGLELSQNQAALAALLSCFLLYLVCSLDSGSADTPSPNPAFSAAHFFCSSKLARFCHFCLCWRPQGGGFPHKVSPFPLPKSPWTLSLSTPFLTSFLELAV